MEYNNVIHYTEQESKYDFATECFVGKAKDLSNMVKGWIKEDLYTNPYENGRPFWDDEFQDALEVANTLDELWADQKDALYKLSYVDCNGFVNGLIVKLEDGKIIREC